MNVGHRSGSFLDPYSDQEKRLVQRLQEKGIVVDEYIVEDEQPVSDGNKEHIASEENVGVDGNEDHVENEGRIAGNKDNSYEAKYRWAIMLIAKLTTIGNNGLSEEDKAVLAKYDAGDGLQPPLKTYFRKKSKIDQVNLLRKEDVPSEPEK
ncbi:hypothetical protein MKW98_005590, partial [Papaver atlanticum]